METIKTDQIQKLLVRPICFFDLETTGVDPEADRIIQICVVKIHPNGVKEIRKRLVNPTIPIPAGATEIHKITDDMVKNEPTFAELHKGILEFTNLCHFAGYNSNRFDIPLLAREFERAGVPPEEIFTGAQFIDVYNMYIDFNRRKLEDAYLKYTGKKLEGAHDAETDVMATIEICEAMLIEHAGELPERIEELSMVGLKNKPVDLFNKISKTAEGIEVFNFGKYKGKGVRDVFKEDPGYFDWLMKSDFPANVKMWFKLIKNTHGK